MHRRASGYSLLEMLIVVALVGIITTIAVGFYRMYVQRTNRTDAMQLLARVAAAQERFYLDNNRYALQADLVQLGFPTATSENGHYQLTINPGPSGDPAIDYVATAQVVPGGGQSDDADCQTFTINETGTRGSQPEPVTTCWD